MALSAAEQAELAQLQKEVGHLDQPQAASGGLSPQEQAEMAQLQKEVGHLDKPDYAARGGGLVGALAQGHGPGSLFFKGAQLAKEYPETAHKIADYPSGLARTAFAGLGNIKSLITGEKPVVGNEDVVAAMKGNAPSLSTYMEKAGVPKGPSANVPYLGEVSARGAAGLLGEAVTDPTNLALRASRPVSELTEKAGQSVYKSGLKKIDEKLAEKGNKPISDVLMNEGKWGTTKTLADDAKQIGKQAFDQRNQIYDKADQLGVKIDMHQSLAGAEGELAKMRKDPGLAPIADKLGELMNRYKEAGPVDLQTASDWKSNLYNSLPESAYDAHGKLKGPAQKFQKALARDFKSSIEDAGNFAEKGLGDEIEKINETGGSALASQKPFAMQVRRATTPNLFSSVDAMIGGYGVHDPATAAGVYAAKKLGDLSKTTAARTGAGLLLKNAGESGAPDALLRRGLIDQQKK